MLTHPRSRALVGLVGVLVVLGAILPVIASSNTISTADIICPTAIVVLGLSFMMNNAGLVSLGQAALTAAGAYTTVIMISAAGVPVPLAIVLGCVAGALVGLIVAIPSVRVKGPYFAIITIIFSWAVPQILDLDQGLTGGYNGLFVSPLQWGGMTATNSLYYVSFPLLVIAALLLANLQRSGVGRALRIIRTNQRAAQAYGINVVWMQVAGVTVGTTLAGLGGALTALNTGAISPDGFTITQSITMLIAAVVGGMESPLGAIIGVVLVQEISQWLASATYWASVVLGAVLLIALLFMPRGIVGLVSDIRDLALSRLGKSDASPLDAEVAAPVMAASGRVSDAA